jgi:acetoin utilization protein AcuB
MKDIPIAELMNSPLVTVGPDQDLNVAVALMEQRNVHHLLVLDRGRLAGIVSSSDLLKLTLLHRPDAGAHDSTAESLGLAVRDIMQTQVAVVRQNSSLREVARALALGGFHALPVLAIDGTPLGIVTSSDLIALLLDQLDRDPQTYRAKPASATPTPDPPLLLDVLRG